jgi:glycerol uptake facilitator-like aquaporin
MGSASQDGGPSRAVLAWRRFVVELLVCAVLLLAIVAIALGASHEPLAAPAMLALASMILAVVRREH